MTTKPRAPCIFSKWCAPSNNLSHVTILLRNVSPPVTAYPASAGDLSGCRPTPPLLVWSLELGLWMEALFHEPTEQKECWTHLRTKWSAHSQDQIHWEGTKSKIKWWWVLGHTAARYVVYIMWVLCPSHTPHTRTTEAGHLSVETGGADRFSHTLQAHK